MSFDVDEKEFYETIAEWEAEGDPSAAKAWAWSVIEQAYRERDEAKQAIAALSRTLTVALRFQAAAYSTWQALRALPRRLRYRFFPKHNFTSVERGPDRKVYTGRVAPGGVPEWLTSTKHSQTVQTPKYKGFRVFIAGVTLTPHPKDKR